jgi:hypothetical protein
LIRHLLDQVPRASLDRRFRAFVETLPPDLATLAADRRLAAGEGPPKPLQTVTEIGIAISGPWAFRDTFPGLSEEQLLDLGESWLYLILAVVLRDHLSDGQIEDSAESGELLQLLTAKARQGLGALIGDRSLFWQRFEGYEQEVVSALDLETHYRVSPDETYDLATAYRICAGKSALFKTVPCAMALLCDAMPRLARLEQSIDLLAAGRQMLDDIVDWREDLDRRHFTFPLVQAASLLKGSAQALSVRAIEAAVLGSTVREDLLVQVRTWYRQAQAAIEGVPCQAWTDFVAFCLAECTWYHRWLIIHQVMQAVGKSDPA